MDVLVEVHDIDELGARPAGPGAAARHQQTATCARFEVSLDHHARACATPCRATASW
jgi:hypothetical protein